MWKLVVVTCLLSVIGSSSLHDFIDLWTGYRDDEGNFIVPYYVTIPLKEAGVVAPSLKRAIDEISRRTCVRFVRRTVGLHKDFISFEKGRSCQSEVGRTGNKQTVTIGGRCTSSPAFVAKILLITLGVYETRYRDEIGREYFDTSETVEDNQVQMRQGFSSNLSTSRRSKLDAFLLPAKVIDAIRKAYHCPSEVASFRRSRNTKSRKCGVPEILPSLILAHRIVGGKQALAGSYPWQVSICFKETNTHFCGGALINSLWILSAAHCFLHSTDPRYYVAYLGRHRLADKSEGIKVDFHLILYHQEYNVATKRNDIGLAKMKESVEFSRRILPVCLPSGPNVKEGDKLIVTGWGATKDIQKFDGLKQVDVPLIDFTQCKQWYSKLEEGMLCAGYAAGGKDACSGDSGGPLVSWRDNGPFKVIGIVSWGEGCGEPEKPGVYTNVTYYLQWIYDSMEHHR